MQQIVPDFGGTPAVEGTNHPPDNPYDFPSASGYPLRLMELAPQTLRPDRAASARGVMANRQSSYYVPA